MTRIECLLCIIVRPYRYVWEEGTLSGQAAFASQGKRQEASLPDEPRLASGLKSAHEGEGLAGLDFQGTYPTTTHISPVRAQIKRYT